MINGGLLRDAVISAAHSISNKKKSVDELNVFPVPDGDTGTNMSMTITNSVAELENLSDIQTAQLWQAQQLLHFLEVQEETQALYFHLFSEALQKDLQAKRKWVRTSL